MKAFLLLLHAADRPANAVKMAADVGKTTSRAAEQREAVSALAKFAGRTRGEPGDTLKKTNGIEVRPATILVGK